MCKVGVMLGTLACYLTSHCENEHHYSSAKHAAVSSKGSTACQHPCRYTCNGIDPSSHKPVMWWQSNSNHCTPCVAARMYLSSPCQQQLQRGVRFSSAATGQSSGCAKYSTRICSWDATCLWV